MNYEKKYEDALERASKLRVQNPFDTVSQMMEHVFPKLKESEDERIRKALINGFKDYKGWDEEWFDGITVRKAIAWLEKQGGQKPILDFKAKDGYVSKVDGKIYNIHHSVDKVEPKFKVDDWIVGANSIYKITSLNDKLNCYIAVTPNNEEVKIPYQFDDGQGHMCFYHLWTIKDAKDGDVLFQDLMCGKTFIYNGVNPDMAILYSFIISNDGKDVLPYHIGKPNTGIGNIEENKNIIHPATKEQSDLLFEKMKEAGYEWDDKKKELKRIENHPMLSDFFNAEYERGKADALNCIGWSEEDEKMYRGVMAVCDVWSTATSFYPKENEDMERLKNWLKSLKTRMSQK